MELFGRGPIPTRPPSDDNKPAPFHVYSMRQAIEEGFILDVLRNYTPYKLAFRLAHGGKEMRRQRGRTQRGAEGHHALGAAAPVQHRAEGADRRRALPRERRAAARRQGQGDGRLRAASRRCAGSWRIDKYIQERGYKIGTLVAFSGEVDDAESGPDPFTETQQDAEPELQGPRHARGVQGRASIKSCSSPTSSRPASTSRCSAACTSTAARGHSGRADAVAAQPRPSRQGHDLRPRLRERARRHPRAFKTYYETAELRTSPIRTSSTTCGRSSTRRGFYDDFEVERVVEVELNPKAKQGDLVAAIEPGRRPAAEAVQGRAGALAAAPRASTTSKAAADAKDELDALLLFKDDIGAFLRHVHVPSQIFDYGNTAIEKRVHLLQAPAAAAGIRPRARGHRPVEGAADAPQPEGAGQAAAAARRGRSAEARAADRDRAGARSRRRRRRGSRRSSRR